MRNNELVKLGIIGCGAIADRYLAALPKNSFHLVAAVDTDEASAMEFQRKYRFDSYATDHRDVMDLLDSAFICVPNYLHAPLSIDFLAKGVNVLCEKPIANNTSEAKDMIESGKISGAHLSVANIRRFYWSSRIVKEIFESGELGDWISIEAEEGLIYSWPTKSGFFFDRSKAGGGVLIDIGSHLLDLILWWVDEYPSHVSYIDDNFGGVEADAEMEMAFENKKHISVKFSRIRNLENTCKINFEKGSIAIRPYDFDLITISNDSGDVKLRENHKRYRIEYYFERMIEDFLLVTSGTKEPHFQAQGVLPSIKLIDQCYSNSRQFQFPWL